MVVSFLLLLLLLLLLPNPSTRISILPSHSTPKK